MRRMETSGSGVCGAAFKRAPCSRPSLEGTAGHYIACDFFEQCRMGALSLFEPQRNFFPLALRSGLATCAGTPGKRRRWDGNFSHRPTFLTIVPRTLKRKTKQKSKNHHPVLRAGTGQLLRAPPESHSVPSVSEENIFYIIYIIFFLIFNSGVTVHQVHCAFYDSY